MGKIGYWSWNERLNAWINTSKGAFYRQVSIRKHPTKKNYAVSVWNENGQQYLMNKNSGSSSWYGMTQKDALQLARKFMRSHPYG